MKRSLLPPLALLALVAAAPLQAAPFGTSSYSGYGSRHGAEPYGWGSPYADLAPLPGQPQDPTAMVREGLDRLNQLIQSSRGVALDPELVRDFLDREIAPYFDLEAMSRLSLGPWGRDLDERQRAILAHGFGHLFFSAMVEQIAAYAEARIRYQSTRLREDSVVVGVQAFLPDYPPIQLDFLLQRDGKRWKIRDVHANGRSAVVHYRGHFGRLVREYGVEGMLRRLAEY